MSDIVKYDDVQGRYMTMDMDSGEIHLVSSWSDDGEDDN